jgi:transposase
MHRGPWKMLSVPSRLAHPADTAIEVILDNHSAQGFARDHELARRAAIGRFTFTFTPTHGSWLNLIEGFFSKLARSVLRYISVSSKHELHERLMAFVDDINREPVVHTWRYKIDNAA